MSSSMNDRVCPVGSNDRLIPTKEVCEIAGGVTRNTLFRWERDGKFPKRIPLSANMNVWVLSEVLSWVGINLKEGLAGAN